MNATVKAKGKGMFRAVMAAMTALMAALLLGALAPAVAYAADNNPLVLTIDQAFNSSSASAQGSFTYVLRPLDPKNPLPATSAQGGYVFTITGSTSENLAPITFDRTGVYSYEIAPRVTAQKTGYTYDDQVYTVDVYVDTDLNVAEVIVFDKDHVKAGRIAFVNSYRALASDPAAMVGLTVKKTVEGNPNKSSMFSFELRASERFQPMPEGSVSDTKTISVVGSGEKDFGVWSYTEEGLYYYTVSEVNTGETGYTFDKTVYTVTDTVTDKDGQLVVSRMICNDMNKQVTSLTFINQYSSGVSGGGGGGVAGPKTGDDSAIPLYSALFVLGALMAAGATRYLILGGKRKRRAPEQ